MKSIDTETLRGTSRDVQCTGCTSLRGVVAEDGMGFSVHVTEIPTGGPSRWHYREHVEACYCVSGRGELADVATGRRYEIRPGVIYVVDENEAHEFTAFEPTVLVSIFNPPCHGHEVHDESGSYKRGVANE